MGLKCLFGHKWNGCKCVLCNTRRSHSWNGCKCERCGTSRGIEHKWQGDICEICGKNKFSVENLRILHKGMTSERVVSIIGNPSFVNSGTNAINFIFGAGQVIGGAELFSSMQGKVYWLYKTPVGDFQLLFDNGRVTSFWSLDSIIELLEKAQ